jgi:hypothetical protein
MAPPRKARTFGAPLPPNCYQKGPSFYFVYKAENGRRRWLSLGRDEAPARQEAEKLNELSMLERSEI